MKKFWIIVLVANILIIWLTLARPDIIVAGIANAQDKYDGDCQLDATTGRCADKCPNPGDILQGFSKDTGAAICYTPLTNPCPFADAEPADSPLCQKLEAEQTVTNITPPAAPLVGK